MNVEQLKENNFLIPKVHVFAGIIVLGVFLFAAIFMALGYVLFQEDDNDSVGYVLEPRANYTRHRIVFEEEVFEFCSSEKAIRITCFAGNDCDNWINDSSIIAMGLTEDNCIKLSQNTNKAKGDQE